VEGGVFGSSLLPFFAPIFTICGQGHCPFQTACLFSLHPKADLGASFPAGVTVWGFWPPGEERLLSRVSQGCGVTRAVSIHGFLYMVFPSLMFPPPPPPSLS
jgi:hypothetical protein